MSTRIQSQQHMIPLWCVFDSGWGLCVLMATLFGGFSEGVYAALYKFFLLSSLVNSACVRDTIAQNAGGFPDGPLRLLLGEARASALETLHPSFLVLVYVFIVHSSLFIVHCSLINSQKDTNVP